MDGKTVIVTGANSGIGKATAAAIVKLRGRVIMACRDTTRAGEAAREIRQQTGADGSQLVVKQLDLASLASIRTFCQDVIKVTTVVREQMTCLHLNNGRPNLIQKMSVSRNVTKE